jgi:dipeptidyl aminopeptidase/acylaminoacyl peptidase
MQHISKKVISQVQGLQKANGTKKIISIGAASFLSLAVVASGIIVGPSSIAKAATTDNNVQYTSFLDYSPTTVLLKEQEFGASTLYDCSISSLACSAVASTTTSLPSPAAANMPGAQLSPDKTEALVPTYTPGSSPTETLYAIQNATLSKKATLPTIAGLITNILWSSDGNVLILVESDGTVQKFNASDNTLTTLTSLPDNDDPAWTTLSPNGEYLAYYVDATVSSGKRTFGVVDTDTDTNYSMTESTKYWDLLSEGVRIFSFSPDSTKLLYLDDRSGYPTLYEVNLANIASTNGLSGTPITTKTYSIDDMVWQNNSTIIFSANRDNPLIWSLYAYNTGTSAVTKIANNIAYNQAMEMDGTNLIFQTADANGRMTHLYNTATKQVSNFTIPGVTQSSVDTTSQIVTENGVNGAYLPSTTATTTLLVWLHGGPDRQTEPDYNSYMSYGGYDWVLKQVQTAGVPVLKLNYPGSIGYGTQYAASVEGGVGTVDASSTMEAINSFAATHGFKNIYIMGNSYGGYLALKLLTSYPNQIDGVFSDSGVTDWQTLLTNVPSSIFSIDFNGPPDATNTELYANASVVNNISAIGNQKVILVQGNADTEVPYGQSVLMNAALVAAGKNVDYTTLQGENHIYELPSSYTLVCNKAFSLVGLPANPGLCTMD